MFIIIKKSRPFLIVIFIMIILILFICIYKIFIKHNIITNNTVKNESTYLILIQIEEKTLYLFEDSKYIKEYPISSGKPGWPSPIGEWEIINKSYWGEGFGGRWMGLNVKWGKYGIHGTTSQGSIGRAASHGCIRMFNKDIKELYDIIPIGTPVIIKNGPFGPFGTGFRDLIPGDRGSDVFAVQQKLKELGYLNGQESGIYDDNLKNALYKFQKDNNLTIKYTITLDDYHAMGFREFE